MSKDARNVPALRFKGYSDAWEKRKFKDLVVRVNKTSDDSTIPSVEFEDIISKQGRLNKDVRLKINSKQGIYFEPQDVLFGKLRPYLQNWLFPSFYGRAVGDFWVLRANSSVLSEYLFVLIQSPRFQIVANISSGTKMPRSDWNTVSNTSFPIPVQSEQRKIWQLFNVLDNLIAATQDKIDALEQAKKALLQRLFDQSWRFKGYSDPWEKRKLGEIFNVVTDYVANGSFKSLRQRVSTYSNPNFAYMIRLQDASNNWKGPWLYTDQQSYSFLAKTKLNPGDILMSNVGSVGKFFLVPDLDRPMTLAPNAILLRSMTYSTYFLFQLLQTSSMTESINEKTTPGVQQKINKTDLKKIITNVPTLNESSMVGQMLSLLDNLIAATQSRLSSLELLKKSLLQDLFI